MSEPQEPITEADDGGRPPLDPVTRAYDRGFLDGAKYTREQVAEARAAAPPDIDVDALDEALDKYVMPLRGIVIPTAQIVVEYRRLASPDAKP